MGVRLKVRYTAPIGPGNHPLDGHVCWALDEAYMTLCWRMALLAILGDRALGERLVQEQE